MSEDKYTKFIEGLIHQTKQNKIPWEYLDADSEIVDRIDDSVGVSCPLTEDDCFFYQIGNTYVVILTCANDQVSELMIVPNTFHQIKILNEGYTELIIRLRENIKRLFPNPDDFVDEFLATLSKDS